MAPKQLRKDKSKAERKREEAGRAFIGAREKRASQLETSSRGKISAKAGAEQASRELSARGTREQEKDPAIIAGKKIEVAKAERRILAEEQEKVEIERQKTKEEFTLGVLTGDPLFPQNMTTLEKIKMFTFTGVPNVAQPTAPFGVTGVSEGLSAAKNIDQLTKLSKIDKLKYIPEKGTQVEQLFGYAHNSKTIIETGGMLSKLKMGMGAIGTLMAAVGTYPFAGFIVEEATQRTGWAFSTAQRNGDVQGMEEAIRVEEEILNAAPSVLDKIPFANVLNKLNDYYKAVSVNLEINKRVLAGLSEN